VALSGPVQPFLFWFLAYLADITGYRCSATCSCAIQQLLSFATVWVWCHAQKVCLADSKHGGCPAGYCQWAHLGCNGCGFTLAVHMRIFNTVVKSSGFAVDGAGILTKCV
jgi:hypothetical protein